MSKKPVYPAKGTIADEKAMKKLVKPMTDEAIAAWVAHEKLVVKDYGSAPINRMRQIMAIKELHFPSPAKAAKQASPYAQYSLEALVALASDKSVPVEVCENERILRMRVIMALRAHKVL